MNDGIELTINDPDVGTVSRNSIGFF